ncbi:Pif-1 [Phenacoccus solenopsis nudivirus]|nr:Pif-1 [Phenacoccus solenopsis nudivirus]
MIAVNVLLVVVIVLIVFVTFVIENKKHILKLGKRHTAFIESDLKRFKTDIEFNDYPENFKITNKYDCNVRSLRPCKMDDVRTLYGCRELNVKCHHFSTDTKHYKPDGETVEYVIPANETPNDGYALAITSITENCNFYHGDLVIVSQSVDSKDYLMVCRCKKEGFIGNDHLLGNCTSIRICNGKVKDINVPFEKIECVCASYEKSKVHGIAPACATLTILEANKQYEDWSNIMPYPSDVKLMNIKYFNASIRDNVNVNFLRSTCSYSLLDPSQKLENVVFDVGRNTCRFMSGMHIPVRKLLLQESEKQLARNKQTYKDKIECLAMYDAVLPSSTKFLKAIVSDHVMNARQTLALVTEIPFAEENPHQYKRVAVGHDVGFSTNGIVYSSLRDKFYRGECYHYWTQMSYHCELKVMDCTFGYGGIPKATTEKCCPWGGDNWYKAYDYALAFQDKGYGVEILPSESQIYGPVVSCYGAQFVNENMKGDLDANGPLVMVSVIAWNEYRQLLDEV